MTIRWTRIHANLGEPPGELTYAMLEAAVAASMPEAEDLDWKKALPEKQEQRLEEFAKDVAAMANTRGGLIVYGIRETGKGLAAEIMTVDNGEAEQRRLRALAFARIRPPVAGLDLVPLTSPDGAKSALVLSIPRSPDAPHIIGQGNQLGVPFRSGADTHWMREREIERAYRDRFDLHTATNSRLTEMLVECRDRLDIYATPWIIAAARPVTPLPGLTVPPSKTDITSVFHDTLKQAFQIAPHGHDRYAVIHQLGGDEVSNPRVGQRRWIVRLPKYDDPYGPTNRLHIELHHDGSVVLAQALEVMKAANDVDPSTDFTYQVPCSVVEGFAADFVAIVDTYARSLGGQAPLAYRVELSGANPATPFTAITRDQMINYMLRAPGSTTLRAIMPAAGEIQPGADTETLQLAARDLAADVLNQFGIARLRLWPGA